MLAAFNLWHWFRHLPPWVVPWWVWVGLACGLVLSWLQSVGEDSWKRPYYDIAERARRSKERSEAPSPPAKGES